ncbi:type II toxin-antitoxin system CcdA family antitoxin [Methylomonas koyamae]
MPTNNSELSEQAWRQEYTEFVLIYNRVLESEGLPLGKWRSF